MRRAAGGGSATGTAPRTGVAWRERAASLLPALPPGTSLGSTLGSWLSLPALLVVSCVAAFWRGDRSLVAALRGAHSTLSRRQRSGVQGTFWQRHASWLRASLVGVAFGALGHVVDLSTIEDALLAVLLVSMLVLTSQISGGVMSGRVMGSLLRWTNPLPGWVLVSGLVFVQVLRFWRLHRFGLAAFWGLVALGLGTLCIRVPLDAVMGTPPRSVWQWLVDERLSVGSLLLVVLALRAVWFTRPLGAVGRGALP